MCIRQRPSNEFGGHPHVGALIFIAPICYIDFINKKGHTISILVMFPKNINYRCNYRTYCCNYCRNKIRIFK